jgi:uncharacterized tellurite resistance protein B-like protein
MQGKENLYYALGEIAYAVAKADGTVQREERQKIHDIMVKEIACHNNNFSVSEIIFHILKKQDMKWETVYNWGIKQMKLYNHYLTDDMKVDFVAVIEKIAHAFDSVTIEEENVIEKFRKDIKEIKTTN